jgi:hypothetical protein
MGDADKVMERIVRLEMRLDKDDEARKERQAEVDRTLFEIRQTQDEIKTEMTRYKGVVGGISLAVSILWAAIALLKDTISGWGR